jgi:hypothetical protein
MWDQILYSVRVGNQDGAMLVSIVQSNIRRRTRVSMPYGATSYLPLMWDQILYSVVWDQILYSVVAVLGCN